MVAVPFFAASYRAQREFDREIAQAQKCHAQIQYAMRGRNLTKSKKVPMQPMTVTIRSTVHEYASGALPRSGARTTSMAANKGLSGSACIQIPSASGGQNTGVTKNNTCTKFATIGGTSR